jgi:hypothetical protein
MAKTVRAAASAATIRQVSSLVKKDIASLQAHANRLNSFLKSPGAVAIKICECCINVSMPDPGKVVTPATRRGRRR